MKRLTFTRYTAEHALEIERETSMESFPAEWFRRWAQEREKSIAYTFFDGDRPVYCGGVRIYWPGAGEAWILMIAGIKRYCSVHVRAKLMFEYVIKMHELDRVQAYARADRPEFARYLEYMGFEKEALCRKFGPGGIDSFLYARIRK